MRMAVDPLRFVRRPLPRSGGAAAASGSTAAVSSGAAPVCEWRLARLAGDSFPGLSSVAIDQQFESWMV